MLYYKFKRCYNRNRETQIFYSKGKTIDEIMLDIAKQFLINGEEELKRCGLKVIKPNIDNIKIKYLKNEKNIYYLSIFSNNTYYIYGELIEISGGEYIEHTLL